MHVSRRRRRYLILMLVVTPLCLATYALAAGVRSDRSSRADSAQRAFGVLRVKARAARDAIPAQAVPEEVKLAGARRATLTPRGAEVFAAPSADGVCVVALDQGWSSTSCAPTGRAVLGETVQLSACTPGLAPGEARVVALLPDGVASAVASGASGSRRLQVTNNVVVLESSAVPAELRWVAGGTTRTVAVPGGNLPVPTNCVTPADQDLDHGTDEP